MNSRLLTLTLGLLIGLFSHAFAISQISPLAKTNGIEVSLDNKKPSAKEMHVTVTPIEKRATFETQIVADNLGHTLMIDLAGGSKTQLFVEIKNEKGQTVVNETFNSHAQGTSVDIRHLGEGAYTLSIASSDQNDIHVYHLYKQL